MMRSRTIKKMLTRGVIGFLLVSILAIHPIDPRGKVQVAEAGGAGGPFALEVTNIQNAIASTFSAAADATLLGKELTLDGIFFAIAKIFLSSMIRSLTNWVNSGFNGSPTFVQDLKEHLVNVADEAAAEFLFSEDGLGFTALETLCSPFQLDVQFAITNSIAGRLSQEDDGYRAQCTLSEMAGNLQNFMQGDFGGGGGWQNWVQVTQDPYNNTAYGARMSAEAAFMNFMAQKQANEKLTLNFGQGFLSMKDANGHITTPGALIAGQMNKALGAGQDVLVEADEINELIAALFYQLVNRIFGSVGGLAGAGGDAFFSDNGDGIIGPTLDFDDLFVPPNPDDIGDNPADPVDPTDPTDPSIDPVDPFTDEPLDPTIPGTNDESIDPVTEVIEDNLDDIPTADPVTSTSTDSVDSP